MGFLTQRKGRKLGCCPCSVRRTAQKNRPAGDIPTGRAKKGEGGGLLLIFEPLALLQAKEGFPLVVVDHLGARIFRDRPGLR